MKITNAQLVSSVPSLNVLNGLKLPVKASYWVAKTSRVVQNSIEDYQEALSKLQKKHAELDENDEMKTEGDKVIFKDPNAFQEEFQELLKMEVELNLNKISLDSLGDVEIEPSLLYHLDWFLED